MTTITLHEADCREAMRQMIGDGVQVHSVVTDPPYGLTSVVKRFGKEDSSPAGFGSDGAYARQSAGFMGQTWDGTQIERDPELWRLVFDLLLPGGFVFAFAGARTGHWQACAMEQAGFIMHPMHGWVYGQGMPKAKNAALMIDKVSSASGERDATGAYVAQTPEAEPWTGWAYGTQTQKPAIEPIFLGQKPLKESSAARNILELGTGAFNVEACKNGGRWPANLMHDGSAEVGAMFPDTGKSGKAVRHRSGGKNCHSGEKKPPLPDMGYDDGGSASRFFHAFEPDTDPLVYAPKAGKEDRSGSTHPTIKPVGLLQYLIRHVTPPGGTVLDPFAGSGTTAEAAHREGFDCTLIESHPEYAAFLRERFEVSSTDDIDDILGDLPADLEDVL